MWSAPVPLKPDTTYEQTRVRNRVDYARKHNDDRRNHEHDQGMLDERSL